MLPDSTVKDRKKIGKKRKSVDCLSDEPTGISSKKTKKPSDKKSKKPLKKKLKNSSKDEYSAADLDLTKEIYAICHYLKDRKEMVKQLFLSLKKTDILSMLPEPLKKYTLSEVEAFCCDQADIMSKKRILALINGQKNEDISSSGTEDEDTPSRNQAVKNNQETSEAPDSTSTDVGYQVDDMCDRVKPQTVSITLESASLPADKDKLEILELELRARAIKRMLERHSADELTLAHNDHNGKAVDGFPVTRIKDEKEINDGLPQASHRSTSGQVDEGGPGEIVEISVNFHDASQDSMTPTDKATSWDVMENTVEKASTSADQIASCDVLDIGLDERLSDSELSTQSDGESNSQQPQGLQQSRNQEQTKTNIHGDDLEKGCLTRSLTSEITAQRYRYSRDNLCRDGSHQVSHQVEKGKNRRKHKASVSGSSNKQSKGRFIGYEAYKIERSYSKNSESVKSDGRYSYKSLTRYSEESSRPDYPEDTDIDRKLSRQYSREKSNRLAYDEYLYKRRIPSESSRRDKSRGHSPRSRGRSPVRFPSPDIEVLESVPKPKPPVVVLSDSD